MIDTITALSILLAFGSFSLVESYLRAFATAEDQVWLLAFCAGGAAALLGYLIQLYTGVNIVVVSFSLSVAFTAVWLMLNGDGRWQGRARR